MEDMKEPVVEDELDTLADSEEGEEEEDEEEEELGSSPLGDHLMMALATTNVLPYEGLASPLRLTAGSGKPLTLKRSRGRPAGRAEPKVKKPLGLKLKRWKGGLYMPSDKSPRHSLDGDDGASDKIEHSPAHSSEPATPSTPSGHNAPALDDAPYFSETWPGKVCVMCNLSERSLLGQGEMLRLVCQEGFVPQRPATPQTSANASDDTSAGPDKSPRTPALSARRQKNWAKCRNVVLSGQEPLDELSIVGYTEEPDLVSLFENAVTVWHVYVHENCALWSLGVSRPTDADFQTIGPIVVSACFRKCSYCGRLGASVACSFNNCQRALHHPCAAASGAFQDSKSYSLVCNLHLDQVSLMPGLGDVTCMTCYSLGDVRNLMMCSMCGNHYHGSCVGLALLPGVRAGWQCQDCRLCRVCRSPEDGKVMLCETCDKAYHPHCLRPIVTSIPKYGWKCKCCRVCSDCGSRTPGAGQSSRWHAHYTVCDSCYQQRNKGFSCPLCRRAYRAAAYREMVQCNRCKRFVHGTCDPDADLVTYQQRKDATPEYEYICLNCKNEPKKRMDDFGMDSNMSASQESLVGDEFDFDYEKEGYGMGKGKPFCASKIAKKKLGLGFGGPGRPPGKLGTGKMSGISASMMLNYQKKQQRMNEFGRKRMPKAKMRGIFGVPGLGLQKPSGDGGKDKNNDEDSENKLVLCSAKDKFVLNQDLCVACGALGTDQEGCLIACAQCGQCYHPYCASVKVTKVILQKGWRCLDCTVCEGCGQRNDEARLLLCDDCDISYHIYCMNPPLTYVPRGTWKCKWCAQCQTCGVSEPGVNCSWLENYTKCGPCGSRTQCPSCQQPYVDQELIIKCIQCDRWIHGRCDNIQTEDEAEMCAEDGYRCLMCRPKDVKLPHLLAGVLHRPSTSTPTERPISPEFTKSSEGDFYMVDGVRLSENGMYQIRALTMEQQIQPRRRRPNSKRLGSSTILDTIESVIAGGCYGDNDDIDEPEEDKVEEKVYREGMPVYPRPDGRPPEPPEGFTIYTTESGAMVLRRKRVRNLQRLGIGGFNARLRQTRYKEKDDGDGDDMPQTPMMMDDKPRRKPQRRKIKCKLAENYPSYLQEAFFGRDLLDTSLSRAAQDLNSSSDDDDKDKADDKTMTLSQELKEIQQMSVKEEKKPDTSKEEESSDTEALKDILRLPDNLLDTELVNTIMSESSTDIKTEESLIADSTISGERNSTTGSSKDELSEILGPHFNLVNMVRQTGLPNMDCKDVEEIFKGVLTDETPQTTEYQNPPPTPSQPVPSVIQTRPAMPHSNIQTPISFSTATPYHPEYTNTAMMGWTDPDSQTELSPQNLLAMEADETLGNTATIAAILYANISHPEWKKEFPAFIDRSKQIVKAWRSLTPDQRHPFIQAARDNRNNLRLKKSQEQEKLAQAKSAREAEQERQWKHMQALRQQQAQQQQQMMQDQRVQGTIPTQRVRQMTTEQVVNLSTEGQPQLQTPVGPQQVTRMVAPRVWFQGTQRAMNPEMSKQLRDLLQRQQIKTRLESDRPWPQEGGIVSPVVTDSSLLISPPTPAPQQTQFVETQATTFRHPLPLQQQQQQQQQQRMPTLDPRMQGVEGRVRLLLQQRPGFTPAQAQMMRLTAVRNTLDPYAHLVTQQRPAVPVAVSQFAKAPAPGPGPTGSGEEIPDSVTAELEKLEQEEGVVGEVEGVNAILGDLVEDDDELLAEMGADFNILEYADPELDKVGGGEKTNIFDDDEFEEDDSKKDSAGNHRSEKKEVGTNLKTGSTTATAQASQVEASAGKLNSQATMAKGASAASVPATTPETQMSQSSQPTLSQVPNKVLPVQSQATVAGVFPSSFPQNPSAQGIPRVQHLGQVVAQQQQRLQQLQRLGVAGPRGPPALAPQASRLPPPYPGPPPPYPGPGNIQQEQPLLLEDLLEQEKREQEKQQSSAGTPSVEAGSGEMIPANAGNSASLLSDTDFERLRAEVLATGSQKNNVVASPPHALLSGQGMRPYMAPRAQTQTPQWAQTSTMVRTPGSLAASETGVRMPMLTQPVLPSPPPPPPPENILTEEDRRTAIVYETWLRDQNNTVTRQLKQFETEVQKLRKLRKSLNSKQRQLRKNGSELAENDAAELQRVTSETQALQKQLESSRKQSRQHATLIQEYRNKQQAKVGGGVGVVLSGSPQSSQLSSPPMAGSESPRIGTPLSQQSDEGVSGSPRPLVLSSTPRPVLTPTTPASPSTPSPSLDQQQPLQLRGLVLSQGQGRPRVMLPTHSHSQFQLNTAAGDKLRPMLTPQQQQQLLLQRHQQLQQQKLALLQQQQDLNQEAGGLSAQQRQLQIAAQRQALQQQIDLLQTQMTDPTLNPQQRQTYLQQRQALQMQLSDLTDRTHRVILQGENATDLARQHQLQLLQRQQFQRQQMLSKSQQQFRQQVPQQSPSRSPMGQFGGTSPMPQHYVNTPTSPMPPQSPQQFPGNSPHSQSPMLTNSSPIMPQSPMPGGNVQFQPNVTSPHPQSPMVQYVNQTPNSPLHPLSPRVQQNFGNNPQSPITTPQSPMIQQSYTPNSPMHHFSQPSSPRPPQSPRIQSQFQHPSSPMGAPQSPHPHIQQNQMQNQFVHRPNSPIRSPMPPASPMPMRRPSSTGASSQMEQQMMENPSPRMNYGNNEEMNQGGGGGNPHLNPIPAPPGLLGRFGYIKLGLRGGSPMWGDRTPNKRPTLSGKTINTNESSQFEDSSASTSKSPQKKSDSVETQEGAMKNDEETVYDDIVLVENETNLEVEELQSSLHGNVMGMPMVIDGDNMRVADINLDSANVGIEDCLVTSTNLVVLDVDRSGSGEETEACLLDIVDKDEEAESIQEDSLMLEEEESKDDESDMIEMMEESMSPPTGRKRLVGKVLPGESLKKLQEKRDSTTDTPDSPEPEDVTNEQSPEAYTSETDNEMVSSTFESKPEPQVDQETKQEQQQERPDSVKSSFPYVLPPGSQIPPSSAHQANLGVARTTVSYPTYPRGVPRNVFPLIRSDGRSVIAVQQAAVANLVQDAVNAAKLAAEKKQFPQNVSMGGNMIPTLMSTPSTIASIGVVSTTGTTLLAPPRMSVPMSASTRITQSSAQTTHYMPILSQSRGGLLKIEVFNQKLESEGDKTSQKQQQVVSRQIPTTEIPEGFQKHFVDSVSQNLSREEGKRNEQVQIVGPHPSKAHSYSKLLVEESKTNEVSRSESSNQSSFGDFMQRSGVICSKTTASGNQHSSVINQVSVINESKSNQQEETTPMTTGSSILEAQLTASTREDILAPRNPAVSSPSKTLFSFLDQNRDIKKPQREPQSGIVNLLDMSVTYDDNKAHTESVTLYRSSENIMTQSNISQMLKTQQQSDVKFPVSMMSQISDKQEGLQTQPAIRRIGNIYVHSQQIKSEEPEGEGQRISYQNEQNRQKLEPTPVIKTEIKAASNISELFRQQQPLFEQKPQTTQQQEISSPFTTSNSSLTPIKTLPTRLGELISGGTNVHAHIERRLSIAGQNDLDLVKAQMQNFAQNQNNMTESMQHKIVSSSESSTMFAQRETKDSSSQFIPLSSILTPKSEPDDKRYMSGRGSDDSQNVLLKQLLQNTACATTTATSNSGSVSSGGVAVSVGSGATPVVSETETAVPPPPPPPASAPPVLTPPQPQPSMQPQIQPQQQVFQPNIRTQQTSPMQEPRRMSIDTPTSTLDELLSPTSPNIKREPLLTPSQIKREPTLIGQPQVQMQHQMSQVSHVHGIPHVAKSSPVMVEVKKEVMSSDEMISPGIRSMDPLDHQMDHSNMPMAPEDLKKLKRRQYQQKRRQSQGKDGMTPKKRPRKSSKVEEDYDSFIESLMNQLRQTPAMQVLEPSLSRNFSVCAIYGAGDLTKVHLNSRTGELKGSYGNAMYNDGDLYNTVPYGELLPTPTTPLPSTQRGFYNEEFSPPHLDTNRNEFDDRKYDFNRDRDNDTPDTIVSSSSPELIIPEPFIRYPGLRLIEEDESEEEEKMFRRSPIIPIVIPTAIKPVSKVTSEMDKENAFKDNSVVKRVSPSIPLKDSANVTVTLTLTSAAADDVLGVLRNLANVLRIPTPTAYHITERTSTPTSKLGLYRTKGKDGKEGAPVDIQSILNGEAKFCRHCDVIIQNNDVLIRKKAAQMPFLSKEESTEDLFFCSSECYMQLALTQHLPSAAQDKAAAVVDHLSQNEPTPAKKSKISIFENQSETKLKLKIELKEGSPKSEISSNMVKKQENVKKEEEKPKLKGVKYRVWTSNNIPPASAKFKRLSDKEMTEMLFRAQITILPPELPNDGRTCLFCHQQRDGVADGPARLLNYDVDKWVHLNCALWSDEVYETVNGALMNVETVLQQSLTAVCVHCNQSGATLKCYKLRCSLMYHLPCAVKSHCVFYKNKTLYCSAHVPKGEKDNELTTLSVYRRVYINRDENRQVASIMHHTEHNNVMRVGTMILLNIGQLLPHQLVNFHTPNYIYPIGYKIVRFFWSMRVVNKRCRYICSIHEANGRPEFRVLVQEPNQEDIELRDVSARSVWVRILEPLVALRKSNGCIQVFPRYVSGEELFGLTEPAIVRVLESLPGIDTLTDYRFKYGRNPLLELPLAINPSGCARCEPKQKGQEKYKRAHTQRTTSSSARANYVATNHSALGEAFSPYSKQFVHSKSSQYKKMKQEWRNNVYLARSKIQGLGLYAARDLEKYTMIIEYIGELIRTELAESREKQYEAKNRGTYMFRLDEERVIDATLSGGLARYINHSCNPNCVAEVVEVERDVRIIIFAKRRINRGEELAYDYKFDIEDESHKIPCNCGAPNCKKWMN